MYKLWTVNNYFNEVTVIIYLNEDRYFITELSNKNEQITKQLIQYSLHFSKKQTKEMYPEIDLNEPDFEHETIEGLIDYYKLLN